MKKRILTWLLAISMLGSLLTVPAGAAAVTKFSDVSDSYTATAVETLRLMGVLDGYGDGTFRPDTILNRAQFCKMAVYAMDGSEELGRYSTVTIFPDVKPSHWASAYINMAAKKGIISGFADGKFKPGQTVTAGQAVTILMRGLGYKDEDMGGVWPQSYMAEAQTNGLLKSTGITSAYAGLTRAQAAKLFLNLFEAKPKGESALFAHNVNKEEVYLTAVDGGKGTMTAGGKTYTMAHPVASTSLIGSRGKVVLNGTGEALTFLPVTGNGGVSNAAVIIESDGSTAGLAALAGTTDYKIYKNGTAVSSASDLRRYDVATYSPATNSIIVSDTRISVYYEDCSPSAGKPTSITVLGGTKLNVLSTATDALSKFKPGQQMTILLTADGQVAGAMAAEGNARPNGTAVVIGGKVMLLCGGALLDVGSASGYEGKAVSVSSTNKGVNLSVLSGGVSGDLNTRHKKLGSRALTENVVIVDGGKQVALGQLNREIISSGHIAYAHLNWAGEVDLAVMNIGLDTDMTFGRIKSVVESSKPEEARTIVIETGNGKPETIEGNYGVKTGEFVAVSKEPNELGVYTFSTLAKLTNISSSSWIDNTAVNNGNRTYEVSSNVRCYNADAGTWFDSLDAARDYGGTMDLYIYDGVVRIVEVRS